MVTTQPPEQGALREHQAPRDGTLSRMDDTERKRLRSLGASMYRQALADAGVTEVSPAVKARIIEAVCGGSPRTPTAAQRGRVLAYYYRHPCVPSEPGESE